MQLHSCSLSNIILTVLSTKDLDDRSAANKSCKHLWFCKIPATPVTATRAAVTPAVSEVIPSTGAWATPTPIIPSVILNPLLTLVSAKQSLPQISAQYTLCVKYFHTGKLCYWLHCMCHDKKSNEVGTCFTFPITC